MGTKQKHLLVQVFPGDMFHKDTCLCVGVGEVLTDPSVIKSGEKGSVVFTEHVLVFLQKRCL